MRFPQEWWWWWRWWLCTSNIDRAKHFLLINALLGVYRMWIIWCWDHDNLWFPWLGELVWFWLRGLCSSISCANLILGSVYMSTYYMEAACYYHERRKNNIRISFHCWSSQQLVSASDLSCLFFVRNTRYRGHLFIHIDAKFWPFYYWYLVDSSS